MRSQRREDKAFNAREAVFVTFTSSLRLSHASPREVEVFLMARWHLSYRSFLCRVDSVCRVCAYRSFFLPCRFCLSCVRVQVVSLPCRFCLSCVCVQVVSLPCKFSLSCVCLQVVSLREYCFLSFLPVVKK